MWNDINLINSDIVSDVFSKDPDFDDIIRIIDAAQIPIKYTNNNTNVSAGVNTNFSMPVLHKYSNITIYFNFNH